MTNMNTADQPVNDAQNQPAQAPIVVHGEFGTITWTLSQHVQDHLQRLPAEGESGLKGYLEFAANGLTELGNQAAGILCVNENPLLLLVASLSGLADLPDSPPVGPFGPDFFGPNAVDPFDLY